jgi:hypothetical protein
MEVGLTRRWARSGAAVAGVAIALVAVAVGYFLLLGPRRVVAELDALRQDFVDFYRSFLLDPLEED